MRAIPPFLCGAVVSVLTVLLALPLSAQEGAASLPTAAPAIAPEVPLPAAEAPPPAEGGAPALTREDAEAWLDGFLPYALAAGDIAGAVVVVVKDGEVLLQKGYGYANLAERTPVDPEQTLFRPGSVSKLFTWTAVMQLVEQGKLDLDADLNQYIDFPIPARDGKPITLRQVMTHTRSACRRSVSSQSCNGVPVKSFWTTCTGTSGGSIPGSRKVLGY